MNVCWKRIRKNRLQKMSRLFPEQQKRIPYLQDQSMWQQKNRNTGSVSAPERREAPTRSRTIIRRNPEYRSNNSNNYGRSENTGRQNSYNGENRPENFVKRTTVAKPVEVVPPAELRPEETEQPRTGAASENRTEEGVSNAYNVPAETVQLDSGEKANGILEVMPDGFRI